MSGYKHERWEALATPAGKHSQNQKEISRTRHLNKRFEREERRRLRRTAAAGSVASEEERSVAAQCTAKGEGSDAAIAGAVRADQ